MRKILLIPCLTLFSATAFATMPILPNEPQSKTLKTCKVWATRTIHSKEGDPQDAAMMWGLQENGNSSNKIAVQRLTEFCMGREPPEIVGFYSSVGVAERYCQNHSETGLCKKWRKEIK